MLLAQNRKLYIFEGILLIILGLLAIALPGFFTLSIELFFGILLIIAGAYQLYRAVAEHQFKSGFWWWSLALAILNILVGLAFLANPILGIFTLTILLVAYFFISAGYQLAWAWQLGGHNGGWLVAISGLLSLILAAIIFAGLPGSAIWALGLLFGVNLLFSGFTLLSLASVLPSNDTTNTTQIPPKKF